MSLIQCDLNLMLTWSTDCVLLYTDVANQIPTFAITEKNIYVPVVTYQLKIMQKYWDN